ncbi:MAG: hypothetical protein C3F15_01320 [Holophagae bacterium]|nr:MAG: hypothetical protein C3F15_01320 [Holophagae bacterium]
MLLQDVGSVVPGVDRDRDQPNPTRRIRAKVAVMTGQIVVQVVKMKLRATDWFDSSSVLIAPGAPAPSLSSTSGMA